MSLLVSLAPNTDNEASFAKVERGDVGAFTVVYNKYCKLLYVPAYRYLMDKAMAEDAVQHVFTRFWGFHSGLRVGISLKNYLVTVTKSHILNVIRNKNNVIAKDCGTAQSIPEYEGTLIEDLEKKEMVSLFCKVLDRLPPREHKICLIKVRDELTNPEITERMQLFVNIVKTHYSEVLKLLRARLHKSLVFAIYLTLLKYLSVFFILWIIRW